MKYPEETNTGGYVPIDATIPSDQTELMYRDRVEILLSVMQYALVCFNQGRYEAGKQIISETLKHSDGFFHV